MEVACHCPAGFGLAHSHRFHMVNQRGHMHAVYDLETDGIRMWVNWPAVARAMCRV